MWSSISALLIAAGAGTGAGAGVAVAAVPVLDFRQEVTPVVLALSVNGTAGEALIMFTDPLGGFYVPREALAARRLRLVGAKVRMIDDVPHVRINDVDGIRVRVDEAAQLLEITARPELFEETIISFENAEVEPMTRAHPGFLFNYELLGEYSGGRATLSGAFELGVFSGASYVQSTAAMHWTGAGFRATRLGSSWSRDDPETMRTLRIGDSISRGGIGGTPLRFAGIQLARDFAVRPGFVTLPMPTMSGSAALPSVVDVFVNDVLVGSRELQPGPFQISDAPIVSGNGEVGLVVRDILGRETVVRQSYYNAPELLRAGLHDYSYEVGFLRKEYARESFSYGAPMASATHRYGVSDRLTAEAHAEASPDVQSIGVGANLVLQGIGLVGASVAGSRSDTDTGAQVSLGFERRSSAFSFGLSSEWSSAGYRNVGMAKGHTPPARTVQAYLGIPMGFGSLGASYLLREGRGENPDIEFLSASASVRIGRLGTLNIGARRGFGDTDETAVEMFLSVPLGGQRDFSASLRRDGSGLAATAALQKNLPFGEGWGYRAAAAVGDVDRLDGRLQLNTNFGEYGAELSFVDQRFGARVTVAGSLAAVEGDLFASRKLNQSFAAVDVGEHPNVRIYADNHLVARTNKKGRAIIPALRSYQKNTIRLEVADLPLDTIVVSAERTVRPYARSGVGVHFDLPRERSAMMHVSLPDGAPLPVGATVRILGSERDFLSAPGGQLFLAGLEAKNVVEARWPEGTCRFELDLPQVSAPQPDLGEYTCLSTG